MKGGEKRREKPSKLFQELQAQKLLSLKLFEKIQLIWFVEQDSNKKGTGIEMKRKKEEAKEMSQLKCSLELLGILSNLH